MRWILFALTAPAAAVSWLLGLLSIVFFLAHRPRFEQALVLSLELREWFASGIDEKGPWDYSTTLVRTIWWQPGSRDNTEALDERIEKHETVHLRQWEDYMALSFLVGLAVAVAQWCDGGTFGSGLAYWLALWVSGAAWHAPNFATAVMRFGWRGVYRDTEHERSAYAQTDTFHAAESWWDHRERRRKMQDSI